MKIAIVYHGVLRWPGGIDTQLDQLTEHDVDVFFCLQQDDDTFDVLKTIDHQHAIVYKRPTIDWFHNNFNIEKLNNDLNKNWISYAPHLGRSFSLLNYHNLFMISQSLRHVLNAYDIVILSRSDLRAMFPLDFNNFDSDALHIGDGWNQGGYQIIGQWCYGAPDIMARVMNVHYTNLYDHDTLSEKWAHKQNVEAYSKFVVDREKIPVRMYPLNCFISADRLDEESSGYGSLYKPPGVMYIMKWWDQFKQCRDNLNNKE